MTLSQNFTPLTALIFISEKGIEEISSENIQIEMVGEKAYGLACIPSPWTLPFIVISDALLGQYRNDPDLLETWKAKILDALTRVNLNDTMNLIVRSSGCTEGLNERGKLYSFSGHYSNLSKYLKECLDSLINDPELLYDKVPLIIQQYVQVRSGKGHLSNERRCYKDARDWLGEFEDEKLKASEAFKVNLRNWREMLNVEPYLDRAIECNLKVHISKLLRIPATWATDKNLRIHFEWVWDGKKIFLVQADQEKNIHGIDPIKVYADKDYISLNFSPKCLAEIGVKHTKKFNKIHNVFVYEKLNLPIAKLYILDNQEIIRRLAKGMSLEDLDSDLMELTTTDLIIRMDIATDDMTMRQLLPRLSVNNFNDAIAWMKEKSAEILSLTTDYDIAFIFHNFIPAISAAFAYAAPGERKVQIESLWGLPEGLYYNAHDKYIVDTKTSNENTLDIKKFTIERKQYYKRFFVVPDEHGRWSSNLLKPPYDWKESIQKDEWVHAIAYESRRIAKQENEPLSIMWFIGTNQEVYGTQLFPWYHEPFDFSLTSRSKSHRKKTPFDKTFTIRTSEDIEKLKNETLPSSTIRRICIQPSEDNLLRDRNTLKTIGLLTKKLNAIILLEGGILSHAYYQLMQTQAIVEIQHPFDHTDEIREFNKLVRDKIPDNIESGGEIVNIVQLSGESLLKALRDKLVEEAFEVLDATSEEDILEELADVSEVINGILNQLGVDQNELLMIQERKFSKAGGFRDGKVLINTENPLPSNKTDSQNTLFDISELSSSIKEAQYKDVIHNKVTRWDDKRTHQDIDETIMKLSIPVIIENWSAKSSEISLNTIPATKVKLELTGSREGSKSYIEVSIYTQAKKQLTFFDLMDENQL